MAKTDDNSSKENASYEDTIISRDKSSQSSLESAVKFLSKEEKLGDSDSGVVVHDSVRNASVCLRDSEKNLNKQSLNKIIKQPDLNENPAGLSGDNGSYTRFYNFISGDILERWRPALSFTQDQHTYWETSVLAFQTLGVIYGDLGTSPLYVYPTFNIDTPTEQDILGIFSIIFWTLTLVGVVKYVCIVLQADDHGEETVVILSVVILMIVFLAQRFGTTAVSFLFSPIMATWFLTTALVGVYNIAHHYPSILKALSPKYIIILFSRNKERAWTLLGGTVLCITGAEAMFADLGHFNKHSIQMAFSAFVYPSLLLQYGGQSAYLAKHPEDINNAFFKSLPAPIYWPMFVIATLAAVVASQGLISASFSIVKQSVSLHYLPLVTLIHTSPSKEGQIYSPEVNYILMVLSIGVTAGFQTSATLGNAFGVAVIFVMLITTFLISTVMLVVWNTPAVLVLIFFALFMLVEGVYMSAVVTKIPQGGWLPFAISVVLVIIMLSWKYGSSKRYDAEVKSIMSIEDLESVITTTGARKVPGVCFFYSELLQGVPPIVGHYVRNVRSLHQILIFMTIRQIPVKTVLPNERFLVSCLMFRGAYRCIAQYGYMDLVDIEAEEFKTSVVEILKEYIKSKLMEVHELPQEMESPDARHDFWLDEVDELEHAKNAGAVFVLGKTIFKTRSSSSWMETIFTAIYELLQNNCRSVIDTWKIPYSNFLELGMLVEI